jgi:RNA polymerase sigma factor (TIGR02999 family)
MAPDANTVTRLLREWSSGRQDVVEELTPLVYAELRRLATSYFRRERPDHTLQPTALIHEAWMRLVDQGQPQWDSRSHFYSFAAHLMRQILVDHARSRRAFKRGAGGQNFSVSDLDVASPGPDLDVLAVDEALHKLEGIDERKVRIIELRFFSGMTVEEIAEALEISTRTVERELRLARAWLWQALKSEKYIGGVAAENPPV